MRWGAVIEKHFCLDREIDNPDASFSMNPNEFKQMVLDIRQAERAIGRVKYGMSEQKTDSRIFRKSLLGQIASRDIKRGTPLDFLWWNDLKKILKKVICSAGLYKKSRRR